MYELVIVGGGPAGVAAGVYAARKKINTTLITKDFGGQSVNSNAIENWIGVAPVSGADFARMLEEHLRAQETLDIKTGKTVRAIRDGGEAFDVELDDGALVQGLKLLIAAGSHYRRLNVPGEDAYEGKGVFFCSICDAPLMKGKPAAVIGGGNSGLEAAIDLLPYATDIYVLEYLDALRGDPVYQERLSRESKVHVFTSVQVKEIRGDAFVNTLVYQDRGTGEGHTLDVSGVFVAIGMTPNSDLVKGLAALDERGRIIVDHKTFKTSHPRIWAAGDITDELYNQINPAIGDGVKAVLNIYDTILWEHTS